jgi:glutamyl-tRNA reductase
MVESWLRYEAKGPDARILVVGAGSIARDTGRYLAKKRVGKLIFINRTEAKALSLAAQLGGQHRPWEELEREVRGADVVVAATSASQPVIPADWLRDTQFVVDAGLPRNVRVDGRMVVHNIDNIREKQDGTLAERQAAVPEVEAIVARELVDWDKWSAALPFEKAVKYLYLLVDRSSREAGKVWSFLFPGRGPGAEYRTRLLLKRTLHGPVTRLRNAWS